MINFISWFFGSMRFVLSMSFTYFIQNYKTASSGVLILVLVGLRLFEFVTTEALLTCIGVLTSAGLIAAKDAKRKDS